MPQDTGVPLSGSGSRPADRASKAVSPVPASIPNARDFAIKAHGDQRYGSRPYSAHLSDVVRVLADFEYFGEFEAAGWLHDVAEDTAVSLTDIELAFGWDVAALVDCCTGVGKDRVARNESIYRKIEAYPKAAIVKVADRIANVEACRPRTGLAWRYFNEGFVFDKHVARFAPPAMRDRLTRAYASAIEAGTVETEGLDAKHESAIPQGDAHD